MKLIDADAINKELIKLPMTDGLFGIGLDRGIELSMIAIANQPTIDAVPVVRCKDCIHYRAPHVRLDDGTEKEYSEMPAEAFCIFGLVTGEYGINVGGTCEVDKNIGYSEDKTVKRGKEEFCSRGYRRDKY